MTNKLLFFCLKFQIIKTSNKQQVSAAPVLSVALLVVFPLTFILLCLFISTLTSLLVSVCRNLPLSLLPPVWAHFVSTLIAGQVSSIFKFLIIQPWSRRGLSGRDRSVGCSVGSFDT